MAVFVELCSSDCSNTARAVAERNGVAIAVCKAAPGAVMQPAPREWDLRLGTLFRWRLELTQTAHKRAVVI